MAAAPHKIPEGGLGFFIHGATEPDHQLDPVQEPRVECAGCRSHIQDMGRQAQAFQDPGQGPAPGLSFFPSVLIS